MAVSSPVSRASPLKGAPCPRPGRGRAGPGNGRIRPCEQHLPLTAHRPRPGPRPDQPGDEQE